jgi:hypothetical protein
MSEETTNTTEQNTATPTTGKEEHATPAPPAEEAAHEAPEGAGSAEDLFDLMGDAGKQFKKPEPKKTPAPSATAQKKPEPKKYAQGTEVNVFGQKVPLPKEMTEEDVFAFLEDDFPQVTKDRAEMRHDKEKNRLVVSFKSFKKG